MRPRISALLLLLGGVFLATAAGAQESGHVDVHGFGTWAYGRTGSANNYLFGDREGAYDNVEFALNVGVAVSDRLRVNGQISSSEDGLDRATATQLDFAYAEWRVSDRLYFRVGDVKQPFGIYTELLHLGTVRPFLALPQSIYGGSGFAGEAYKGVGLRGDVGGGAWRLSYDVYGGGLSVGESEAGLDYLVEGAQAVEAPALEGTSEVVGGRLVLHTPVEGLSLGASAYNGAPENHDEPRRTVTAGQLEYLAGPLTLRGEMALENEQEAEDHKRVLGGYVEAGYRLGEHLEVAGLYDRLYATLTGVDVSAAPSLLQHTSIGGGLDYWVSSNLVLKASYQGVQGNRFAAPGWQELAAVVQAGQLQKRTSLLLIGAQMSF